MKLLFTIILISGLLFSCKDRNSNRSAETRMDSSKPASKDEDHKMNFLGYKYSQKELNYMIDSALVYGNSEAYSRVSFCYFADEMEDRFLYTALVMANKFKEPQAFYDVNSILAGQDIEFKNSDPVTKSIGMYYLIKSYKLGCEIAQYRVEELFLDKGLPAPSV